MKKDNSVLSGSRKAPLFCVAIFLLILTAMIMTVRTEKVYAALGDITSISVTEPSNPDVWAPVVEVKWQGTGGSWTIYCNDKLLQSGTPNFSIRDSGTIFEAGKTYTYKVAYGSNESKYKTYNYTPDMAKFTPGAISGTAKASGNSVELTWTKKNDLKVNIYQGDSKVATVSSSDESYKFTSLEYDTSYTFKIAYVNQCKEGAQQTLSVKTEAKPADSGSGSGDSGSGDSGSGDSSGGTTPSGDSGSDSSYDPNAPYLSWNDLYATKMSSKKVILRWIGSADAQGYYIYQGKKKIKTVKASVKKITIKRKGAGKAKFKVIAYAKYNGHEYKGLCNAVKPKANGLTTSNSTNYKNYSYGKGQVILKKIKGSGKSYTVTLYAINNRMFKLIKYKKISIKIFADGKCVAKKVIKNKKVNMKKYSAKKMVFKIKGKEGDIANGHATWSIDAKPYWEHGYEGF